MNIDQINGILRIVVPGICTWLAAKGFNWLGDEGIQTEVAAVALAVAAVVWSYFTHTPANTLKRAAKLDPEIRITIPEKIIAKDRQVAAIVDDDNHPNVTQQG